MRGEEGHARIEREIVQEKAAALARITGKLEAHLEALKRLSASLRRADGHQRPQLKQAYESRLANARLYRWYLRVQREALGLTDHSDIDRRYPLPEPESSRF